jgi:hypothetical protein
MARRPDPLVPLALFRRRVFATVNLSTLLVYGALYTMTAFLALFLQGGLGYGATAAGVVTLPTAIVLTLFSTRIGASAGRHGPRPFLVAGPLIMAAALAWLARIPATSEAWHLVPSSASTLAPPASVVIDVLPFSILWAVGLALVVAPLTTTLMSSVPVANAGVASAVNNSISRVGQPILAAVIFVLVSGSFYATLAGAVPGLEAADPALHAMVQPLNPPRPGAPAAVAEAAREASTAALHLAALACAALLVGGAVTSWVGLREGPAGRGEPASGQGSPAPGEPPGGSATP